MPLYMDRHFINGVTQKMIDDDHKKDLLLPGQVWDQYKDILVR